MKLLSKIINFFSLPGVENDPVYQKANQFEKLKQFKADEEKRMAEIEANLYKPTEFMNDKDIT